jgi:exodeoxyribonuclease VII large subunit
MAGPDEISTLAQLRGSRGRRAPRAVAGSTPGLFDAPATAAEEKPTRKTAATSANITEPSMMDEPKVWSVGELVRQVRGLVERSYGQISVEGEISNWRPAASGHCYFTLKDRDAQLSIVMFRRQALLLRFAPKDGDAVRLRGQLSVYESRGQMQLVAETMEPLGLGALLAAVRALKERLRREGLFDRKRPLPEFPRCIGIVTSVQGAALRDMVKVCRRRHAAVQLLIYPAAVQGPRCAAEVAAGVRWFSAHPDRVDVVIVARGGGSWEDLHGFDDEQVARAIATCAVPVITGIGHATDTTIADAAADVCAPTPSAAAELVTAAQHQVEERVARLHARLQRAGRYEVLRARQRLSRLSAEGVLRRVRDSLGQREQQLDEFGYRAEAAVQRSLRAGGERLQRLLARLRRQDVSIRLGEGQRRWEALRLRLRAAPLAAAGSYRARLERAESRLQALSPLRVLERGYALVYVERVGDGKKLLRSSGEVREDEAIVAQLAQGRVRARVTGTE